MRRELWVGGQAAASNGRCEKSANLSAVCQQPAGSEQEVQRRIAVQPVIIVVLLHARRNWGPRGIMVLLLPFNFQD